MENSKDSIAFTLTRISTDHYALIEEAFEDGRDVDFRMQMHFGVEQQQIIVVVNVQFVQESTMFMMIEASCYFKVEENVWKEFSGENNKVTIEKGFLAYLATLAISTTRGILHNKTEGTLFNRFIIPPVNAETFIPDDMTF